MADIVIILCISLAIVAVFRFLQKQKRAGKHCCGDCTLCGGQSACKEIPKDTESADKRQE